MQNEEQKIKTLTELENQIVIAQEVEFLSSADSNALLSQLERTHRLLIGLIGYVRTEY